jgi:DNA mismatch repair protein MutL
VKEETWELKPNSDFLSPPKLFSPPVKNFQREQFTSETLDHISIPTRPLPDKQLESSFFPSYQKRIPSVIKTLINYCLLDGNGNQEFDGLYLLDQKQADFRIKYENLLKNLHGQQAIQQLLIPLTLRFSIPETTLLKTHMESLNQLGFAIREFGDQMFILETFPSIISEQQIETCLLEMIKDLSDREESQQLQMKITEKLAFIASRSSFPKNKQLSIEEAQGLVQQLFTCETLYLSPSGKPIFAFLDFEELPHLFNKYGYFPKPTNHES